jgi:BASS family bile acid:Na+ symporter
MLDTAMQIAALAFVAGSLALTGLGVTPREALRPLKNIRFVFLTLCVGWIVCPAVAYLLLFIVPLERPYALGLVLLALAPGAPFAPAFARATSADDGYIAAFMLLTAAATVVLLPLGVVLFMGETAADPAAVARPMCLFVLLPLCAGTITRGLSATVAARAEHVLGAITRMVTAGLMVLLVVVLGPRILEAVGSFALLTLLAFTAIVTVLTHLCGAPLPDAQRNALTIGMCTRNLGAALAPAAVISSDPDVIVMIAIAVPVTVVMAAGVARVLARRASSHNMARDAGIA